MYTRVTAATGFCCCCTFVETPIGLLPLGRGDGDRVVLQQRGGTQEAVL